MNSWRNCSYLRSSSSAIGRFELAFVHELRHVLDGHHLALEHRENFRQRHGAHLHVSERKLLARDAAREIVHQLFFAHRVAVDDAAFLPLERLALEYLRNTPAQKFDAGLHIFLEAIGLPARQGQQARPVGILEIVDVAAVGGRAGLRLDLLDHALDHSAAAGAGKAANENVVARGGQFHAHAERAQGAGLAQRAGQRLSLRGGFVGDARGVAAPAQLLCGKLRGLSDRLGKHGIHVGREAHGAL